MNAVNLRNLTDEELIAQVHAESYVLNAAGHELLHRFEKVDKQKPFIEALDAIGITRVDEIYALSSFLDASRQFVSDIESPMERVSSLLP